MSAARVRGAHATRAALRDMRAAVRHMEAAERLMLRAGMDADPVGFDDRDDRDEVALDSLLISLNLADATVRDLAAACPPRRRQRRPVA